MAISASTFTTSMNVKYSRTLLLNKIFVMRNVKSQATYLIAKLKLGSVWCLFN